MQSIAAVLAYASGEMLNDVEVQKFYELHEEIERRATRLDCRIVN